jgi:hypothetical protein
MQRISGQHGHSAPTNGKKVVPQLPPSRSPAVAVNDACKGFFAFFFVFSLR